MALAFSFCCGTLGTRWLCPKPWHGPLISGGFFFRFSAIFGWRLQPPWPVRPRRALVTSICLCLAAVLPLVVLLAPGRRPGSANGGLGLVAQAAPELNRKLAPFLLVLVPGGVCCSSPPPPLKLAGYILPLCLQERLG